MDNDLITPTFKVKRNRVDDRFAAHYEQWERTRQKVIWHAGLSVGPVWRNLRRVTRLAGAAASASRSCSAVSP